MADQPAGIMQPIAAAAPQVQKKRAAPGDAAPPQPTKKVIDPKKARVSLEGGLSAWAMG